MLLFIFLNPHFTVGNFFIYNCYCSILLFIIASAFILLFMIYLNPIGRTNFIHSNWRHYIVVYFTFLLITIRIYHFFIVVLNLLDILIIGNWNILEFIWILRWQFKISFIKLRSWSKNNLLLAAQNRLLKIWKLLNTFLILILFQWVITIHSNEVWMQAC